MISESDEAAEPSLPWYKRLFRRHHREDERTPEENSEEPNAVVLEVKNIHKTYLLGLGAPAGAS